MLVGNLVDSVWWDILSAGVLSVQDVVRLEQVSKCLQAVVRHEWLWRLWSRRSGVTKPKEQLGPLRSRYRRKDHSKVWGQIRSWRDLVLLQEGLARQWGQRPFSPLNDSSTQPKPVTTLGGYLCPVELTVQEAIDYAVGTILGPHEILAVLSPRGYRTFNVQSRQTLVDQAERAQGFMDPDLFDEYGRPIAHPVQVIGDDLISMVTDSDIGSYEFDRHDSFTSLRSHRLRLDPSDGKLVAVDPEPLLVPNGALYYTSDGTVLTTVYAWGLGAPQGQVLPITNLSVMCSTPVEEQALAWDGDDTLFMAFPDRRLTAYKLSSLSAAWTLNDPQSAVHKQLHLNVKHAERGKASFVSLVPGSKQDIESDQGEWRKCFIDDSTSALVCFRDKAVVLVHDWSDGLGLQATWINFSPRVLEHRNLSVSAMCVRDGQALFSFDDLSVYILTWRNTSDPNQLTLRFLSVLELDLLRHPMPSATNYSTKDTTEVAVARLLHHYAEAVDSGERWYDELYTSQHPEVVNVKLTASVAYAVLRLCQPRAAPLDDVFYFVVKYWDWTASAWGWNHPEQANALMEKHNNFF